MKYRLDQREKGRVIESKDKRLVHFLFDSGQPYKMSPFARRYTMFIEKGNEELNNHIASEAEAFKAYAEKIASGEELEETDVNPVVEVDMPEEYFQCELSGNLNRLAFSTADDPFYKQVQQRYYPEALVFDKHGALQSRVGP